MAWRKSDLEDHITTLEKFETLYGEFLVERRNRERSWSGEEWAQRERELKELAPQAEAAMVAAGETRWDEGPVRIDLPSRILRFVDEGDGVTEDTDQWQIHDGIPTNIGGLKSKLRRADDGRAETAEPRRRGERWAEDVRQRARAVESRESEEAVAAQHGPIWKLWHDPPPWVLVIGGGLIVTVVGGIALAVILSA